MRNYLYSSASDRIKCHFKQIKQEIYIKISTQRLIFKMRILVPHENDMMSLPLFLIRDMMFFGPLLLVHYMSILLRADTKCHLPMYPIRKTHQLRADQHILLYFKQFLCVEYTAAFDFFHIHVLMHSLLLLLMVLFSLLRQCIWG